MNAVEAFLNMKQIPGEAEHKEEMNDMCKAIQEMYDDGVKDGIQKGKIELLKEQIQRKLKKEKTPTQIAEELEESVEVIEKAIIDSDLGIMPENNGEIIRIGIPPLTEERRKQLAKQCKAEGETAKVSIRNARRDGIDALKKAVKDGLAEDEQKNAEAKLQKVHDKYIAKIEEMLAEKDKEIMTV